MNTISVIIPTYNRNSVLEKAINCLADGSHKPDEIIVVDDGSEKRVEISTGELPFSVKVIRHEKGKGASAARNTGLRLAKSDIVLMMDDDIFADFNFIKFHIKLHEKYSAPEFGVFGRVYFDPEIRRNAVMHFIEEKGANHWMTKLEEGQRFDSGLITANVSLKRKFIQEESQLFKENFPYNRNEDTEFGLRMMKRGLDVRFFSGPSARHHSPLSFTDWISILTKSGRSKAYWMNAQPDDTEMIFQFENFIRLFAQNESINSWIEKLQKEAGHKLDEDWHVLSDINKALLFEALSPIPRMIEGKSIVEGWCDQDNSFLSNSAGIIEAVQERNKKRKAQRYYEIFQKLPHHLPLAFNAVRALINSGMQKKACQTLSKIPHCRWKAYFDWRVAMHSNNAKKDSSKWISSGLEFLRTVDSHRKVDRDFRRRVIDAISHSGMTLSNAGMLELLTDQEKKEMGIHFGKINSANLYALNKLIERQRNLELNFCSPRRAQLKILLRRFMKYRHVYNIKSRLFERSF